MITRASRASNSVAPTLALFALCSQMVCGQNPSVLLFGPAPSSSTLNNGLVSYWKLDEASGTRVDSEPTGTAQDLTDNNTVLYATGVLGNASDFEYSNTESLSRTDSADLSFGDEDLTLVAWVKFESLDPSGLGVSQVLVGKGNLGAASTSEYTLFYLSGTTDRLRFLVSNGASFGFVSADAFGEPSVGQWYFVVCKHRATDNELTIQVNNGTINTASHTLGIQDSNQAFRIGNDNSGTRAADAAIDEVGLWRRDLTADELSELYNAGAGKTCCPF